MNNHIKIKSEIYALVDPRTDEVRYVGVTVQGYIKRATGHIREAGSNKKLDTYKVRWIRSLLSQGVIPGIKLVEKVRPWSDWKEREKFWIRYYKSLGHRLTNATEGGEGVIGLKHSDESRIKMSASQKALWLDDKFREAHKQTEEHIQKRSAALKGRKAARPRGTKMPKEFCDKMQSLPTTFKKGNIYGPGKCKSGCQCAKHDNINAGSFKPGVSSWNKGIPKSTNTGPCKPGCICKRHTSGRKCKPWCSCDRHNDRACAVNCICKRHTDHRCLVGCTCGKHRNKLQAAA